MASRWEFQILRLHTVRTERIMEHAAIGRSHHFVVKRVGEERWRRLRTDLLLIGKQLDQIRLCILAEQVVPRTLVPLSAHADNGIHQHHEIPVGN